MSNETKRDVLKEALRYVPTGYEYDRAEGKEAGNLAEQLLARYDAALPDDLPMIPENIGEAIKAIKCEDATLMDVYQAAAVKHLLAGFLSDWINENINTFARAWLLGVWRVEETGEIVKLEAEE